MKAEMAFVAFIVFVTLGFFGLLFYFSPQPVKTHQEAFCEACAKGCKTSVKVCQERFFTGMICECAP